MPRLTKASLGELSVSVELPTYDRDSIEAGIVHLGIGAFQRAHQAVYTDQAMNLSGGNWGIIGVSLRSDTVARQLLPQDCLYSVLSEGGVEQSLRLVGSVTQVLFAPTQLDEVVSAIAAETTAIITLTITEKGYCTGPDGHSLDRSNPVIEADLAAPEAPRSAIGLLALGLRRRQSLGNSPVTVISCDNVAANGQVIACVLKEYTELAFPELSAWLQHNTSCPSSMVDRIVPASTEAQQLRQSQMLGLTDCSAIATERFSQWIIEDNFCSPRPDWRAAGVQYVENIAPYEEIKLRLLNASHSAIAYCGLLAGKEFVDQVVTDRQLGEFVETLMNDDLMPALNAPSDFDIEGYKSQLLARFRNPCLGHRCEQIAMDGSEKIGHRWLPVLQGSGENSKLIVALAAWCYLVLYTDIAISDPKEAQLLQLRARRDDSRLRELLACARVTQRTVTSVDSLCRQIEQKIDKLAQGGILALVSI
ncbi:Mannitol dehydrogenase rossman domain family [marine gamma proteobacterium HTCC2148]|nr:Mannitol dehydrogenase rossman domain family [marine gamma proteobacterium HTCC2148]